MAKSLDMLPLIYKLLRSLADKECKSSRLCKLCRFFFSPSRYPIFSLKITMRKRHACAGKISNIVHICSSDSYPLMNRSIHSIVSSYLAFDPVANPERTLVRSGNYTVDFVRHRSTFRLRCMSRKVQLAALCAVLKMSGASRNANKVIRASSCPNLCPSGILLVKSLQFSTKKTGRHSGDL